MIAHELAHIKNHDTLIMTITATIAGAISMLAQFGMFFGGNRDSNHGGMGIIGTLAMVILAPIAAMLVQMAISRTREYSADDMGAPHRRPAGWLASALAKTPRRGARDPERGSRAQSGDRAHVHHQSAVGAAHGQSVLDPSGDREPHRRACRSWRRRWARAAAIRRGRARGPPPRQRAGLRPVVGRRCAAAAGPGVKTATRRS